MKQHHKEQPIRLPQQQEQPKKRSVVVPVVVPTQPEIVDQGTSVHVSFCGGAALEVPHHAVHQVHVHTNVVPAASSAFSSLFHASWLWMNHPQNILLPSGQRKYTPGSYSIHRHQIHSALVVTRTQLQQTYQQLLVRSTAPTTTTTQERDTIQHHLFLLEKLDGNEDTTSVHPLRTTTTTTTGTEENSVDHDQKQKNDTTDTKDDHDNRINEEDYILLIIWKQEQQQSVSSSSLSTSIPSSSFLLSSSSSSLLLSRLSTEQLIDKNTSYYHLNWLQQWSYDHQTQTNNIKHREVNPQHTFVYKYNHNNNNNNDNNHENNEKNVTRLSQYHGLRHVDYQQIITKDNNKSSDGLFQSLDAIFLEGAVLVRHAFSYNESHNNDNDNNNNNDEKDDRTQPVSIIGKAIAGTLSHTSLYGDIFHVKSRDHHHHNNTMTTDSTSSNNNGGSSNGNMETITTAPNRNTHTSNSSNTTTNTSAINVAYTSQSLCPHQDLVYYESKPGLQLLHCVQCHEKYIRGGNSVLIDCMAAAYMFRLYCPQYFRILSQYSTTFVKERKGQSPAQPQHTNNNNTSSSRIAETKGAKMIFCRPIIQLRDSSSEIVAVHWSPPFEGPLIAVPPDILPAYFQAYAAFELMIDNTIDPIERNYHSGINNIDLCHKLSTYAHTYTWEYKLKQGEMILFNNTRMLHGRREFYTIVDHNDLENHQNNDDDDHQNNNKSSSNDTARPHYRHLVGAYTNIDDSFNKYRVLLMERQEKEQRRRRQLSLTSNNNNGRNDSSFFPTPAKTIIIPNVGNGTSSV